MSYSAVTPVVGTYPIQSIYVADTTQREQTGLLITAVDNWWGAGEFMYVKANGTIRQFGLCVLTQAFNSTLATWEYLATEVPNTANLGRSLGVAMVGATSGQYIWLCVSGVVPVNCQASVAADTAFGIAAAGQGGAIGNGKQVLNARVVAAGATTVAKTNCYSPSGSLLIQVPNSDGWFIGAYLSGTGVGASAKIVNIDPSGRFVTVDVASSALITGTVTATYNNATIFYNVAYVNRPFAQGQIV